VCVSLVEHKLRLTVNDRGPGFPSQALGRVFDAFYRGDGSSSLGLGLALVERIARAHGGRAWAENRAEGGASVHFELPEA
jgi:signal transduction histidine kinase